MVQEFLSARGLVPIMSAMDGLSSSIFPRTCNVYHVYLYGVNGNEKFREFSDSSKAIALALDWKAMSEYNRVEVYHIVGDQAVKVL